MDRLPNLDAQQMRLLREVHTFWRKNRRFPKTVALSVPLRKEMNVKAVLETIPWRVISRDGAHSGNEVLKLQLPGLALCPGEERIVEAFLELVRRAARQVIANPTRRTKITRDDLRGILQDLSQEDFDLVSPIVKDGFSWGGSEIPSSGEWLREPSLSIIRFEHVNSINEYLKLDSLKPRNIALLEDTHVALLREVCEHWQKHRGWPSAPRFIVAYRTKGDALLLLKEIPNRYRTESHWDTHESKPIVLTLDGVAVTGIADDDLAALVKLVGALIQHFESSPENAIATTAELSVKSGVPEPVVERLAEILEREWRLGIESRRDSVPWRLKISEQILDFEGVDSFLAYVGKREELQRRSGMPEDELDDATIRRGLLDLFARLPEDGSKHLNRFNVLGHPYQTGDLERYLNRTFTMEERARADRITRLLEADGLLTPTYRDISTPADWLILTTKGRKTIVAPHAPIRAEPAPTTVSIAPEPEYDAFLCHASEDKTSVATPLAALMTLAGLRPWIDASQVGWGDSLVKKVEYGLSRSRFVIVFISKASLQKEWPEKVCQT